MILTTRARYATVAIVDMFESGCEKPISLSVISKRQNISLSFLEQIFATLRKAGIVRSIKGSGGGYVLARKPQELNIADIITAIDEPIKMTRCGGKTGCTAKKTRCRTHHLWDGLEKSIYNYLKSISLNDVCKQTKFVQNSSNFT